MRMLRQQKIMADEFSAVIEQEALVLCKTAASLEEGYTKLLHDIGVSIEGEVSFQKIDLVESQAKVIWRDR